MRALTLDTNLLLELWKNQARHAVVEELIRLARDGHIDLAVTARIREDVPRSPLADRINQLPMLQIEESAAVAGLGTWVLGRDMLGSDEFASLSENLNVQLVKQRKTPPDWRDWDHLHAHYLSGRDVFLTWDQRVLECETELQSGLGVSVMAPEEFLSRRP